MSKKIRKGDFVMAITGNEKGRTGKVLTRAGDDVIVQGLNLRKKHVKKSEANPKGGIIEFEKPLHVSNLRVCIDEGTPVKLKTRVNDEGERELVYHQSGNTIVYRTLKKPR